MPLGINLIGTIRKTHGSKDFIRKRSNFHKEILKTPASNLAGKELRRPPGNNPVAEASNSAKKGGKELTPRKLVMDMEQRQMRVDHPKIDMRVTLLITLAMRMRS